MRRIRGSEVDVADGAETMASIAEILKLLESSEFDQAEKELKTLWRDSPSDPIINYLLGCLYDDYRNPRRSRDKARRYLQVSLAADPPFEQAFPRLARVESSNQQRALRILRKGAEIYPDSHEILRALLRGVPSEEVDEIYATMLRGGLADPSSTLFVARVLASRRDYSNALQLVRGLPPTDGVSSLALQLVEASYLLEVGDEKAAIAKLNSVIDEDIGLELEYGAHFALIVARLRHGKQHLEEALRVFFEIPDEYEFVQPFYPCEEGWYFDYMGYLLESVRLLLAATKRTAIAAKARGIRGLAIQAWEPYGYDLHSRVKTRKDLQFAHVKTPGNKKYCTTLFWMERVDGNVFQAYQLGLDLVRWQFGQQAREVALDIDLAFILECCDSDFGKIVEDLKARLADDRESIAHAASCGVLEPVIERLHGAEKHGAIRELAQLVGEYYLKDTDILFEIAYAFGKAEDRAVAARYYELHLQKHGDTSASLNNLAVIREATGELQEAEKLLMKAKSIKPDDPYVKRNLGRITSLRKAASTFRKAPLGEKRALLSLWDERDIDDCIPAEMDQLAEILKLPEREASRLFDQLVDAQILVPVKPPGPQASRDRLEVNPEVRKTLPQLRDEVGRGAELLGIADVLTSGGVTHIGYNEELRHCLNRVSSAELQSMLDRDLREAALGLLTHSYKATLVLCGSLIEAILLDRLKAAGSAKYKCLDGKSRTPGRMSFADLLTTARTEGIVGDELYHLAHALRGFRNLMHPGVEQRKAATAVSEGNAQIAWDITRKLLHEI